MKPKTEGKGIVITSLTGCKVLRSEGFSALSQTASLFVILLRENLNIGAYNQATLAVFAFECK